MKECVITVDLGAFVLITKQHFFIASRYLRFLKGKLALCLARLLLSILDTYIAMDSILDGRLWVWGRDHPLSNIAQVWV